MNSTVCVTFASGQGGDQQGIALRINRTSSETTGLTVTRNVIFGQYNVFNFHTWNTSISKTAPETQFAQFRLDFLPVGPAAYPLDMCPRTIGNDMEFVVWLPGQSQPRWGSTSQGGETEIPNTAPQRGSSGWYVGHVVSGTTTTMTNMTVDGVLDRDPIG